MKDRVIRIGLCLATVIGVAVIVGSAKKYLSKTEYDFSSARSVTNPGRGPAIGDTVTFSKLIGPDGSTLENAGLRDLNVLVIVDPECGASEIAKDQLAEIRSELAAKGFGFHFVSFTYRGSHARFSEFVSSYGGVASGYLWDFSVEAASAELQTMVVPSCLLVSRTGKILRTFPGTSTNSAIRSQMAYQAIKESLQESKTLSGEP